MFFKATVLGVFFFFLVGAVFCCYLFAVTSPVRMYVACPASSHYIYLYFITIKVNNFWTSVLLVIYSY